AAPDAFEASVADALPDVTEDAAIPTGPITLASGLNVPTQTGHAQQRHIVYASASKRFYFFYIDEAQQTKLNVRSSASFVDWREEPALDLLVGHGNEGRNFSVATRVLGG